MLTGRRPHHLDGQPTTHANILMHACFLTNKFRTLVHTPRRNIKTAQRTDNKVVRIAINLFSSYNSLVRYDGWIFFVVVDRSMKSLSVRKQECVNPGPSEISDTAYNVLSYLGCQCSRGITHPSAPPPLLPPPRPHASKV